MKAVLIDNYDSFTYNLYAQLVEMGLQVDVYRNDKVQLKQLEQYDLFFFSPGPGIPNEAGDLLRIIDQFKDTKPMLGICLGMQAIGEVFGSALKLIEKPLHGVSRPVRHFGDLIFEGIASPFEAARYHSWAIDSNQISSDLRVIAESENKDVMAVKHAYYPIFGFQFHPESILTEVGDTLIKNFIQTVKIKRDEEVIGKII
ncbi:MAG: aminodeoxychorismate/anthranilate synthase component II [Crocinitomicaceae bacterium]|nr:aminodeoxychorismate/anthranilate synthase component II [Crocinitomicaceae bacterium]